MKKYYMLIMIFALLFSFGEAVGAEDILIMEDKCENSVENVTIMEPSPDKSSYYHVENGVDMGFLPNETSSDFLYELDIKFNNEGCGFSFMKKGKWNSCIRVKDGNFALQTGGNNFTKYVPIDFEKWYHLTFLGRTNRDVNPVTYGHIILEEYDENGARVNRQVFSNVNLRNNAATHYINVFGCDVDNLKAYTPAPTKLELVSDAESVVAGGSVNFTTSAFWRDLEMNGINSSAVDFEIYDETNTYPIDDENLEISPSGEFKTNPLAAAQTVTVRVTSKASGLCESKKVKVISGEIFTVKGVGVDDGYDKITELTVDMNFSSYKDSVTFVTGFYNKGEKMAGIGFKTFYAENLNEGENKIPMNILAPETFDWNTGKVRVFVVTSVTGSDKDAAVKVKKEELPMFDSSATLVTIKEDCDISKIKAEDILYFDVVRAGKKINIPEYGKTYVFSSVNKIDTLFEVIE